MRLLIIVALVLMPLVSAPCFAQEPGEQVAAQLAAVRDAAPNSPELWRSARTLQSLGEPALPALRDAAKQAATDSQKLALGYALLSLGDGAGLPVLTGIVEGADGVEAPINAARILSRFGREAAEAELSRLLLKCESKVVKVALAQALARAAVTEEAERLGISALVKLAKSPDSAVSTAAALALAATDDFREPVPAILTELAHEPTADGRLAAKLLEMNKISQFVLSDRSTTTFNNPVLDEIRNKLVRYHIEPPPDDSVLVDAAARGLAHVFGATDPYTDYFDPELAARWNEQMRGTYAGIGAAVFNLYGDKRGPVLMPYRTGPAFKAGMRSYDEVIEVDGVPMEGKTIDEARDKLRGAPNTTVACKVRRRALPQDAEIPLQIVRSDIEIHTVYSTMLPGKIGYVRLTSFMQTTADELEQAMLALEKDGMKGLILDLRDNPGGLMISARDIADKFLKDNKLIVYSEGRNPEVAARSELRTTEPATHPEIPLVVLVNNNSASASEIVAGAFQDHRRALLVGERTYGKGSVQQLMPLDSKGHAATLKITIAKYYLPSGRCIDKTKTTPGGIEPDIKVAADVTLTGDQFAKLLLAGDFHRYSFEHWPKEKAELMMLAEDGQAESDYPGFDEWHEQTVIKVDRNSARRMLRAWLRVLASDERGADLVCDVQEDRQLQRAIFESAKLTGLAAKDEPAYRNFTTRLEKELEQ